MHHEMPCDIDVESPEMTNPPEVTDPPATTIGTAPPVVTPAPTTVADSGTEAPSESTKEPCESSDGTFGVVTESMVEVPVYYQYEMETVTGTTESDVEAILPVIEKAIVDSVLSVAFPDVCPNIAFGKKRNLRHDQRRHLAVTGITMNPADIVNKDCKSI
jgi:hypothetical protein